MADVIDVIIAEALGEGPQGMAAVAHVINQRALAEGKTPEQIVNEPGQFSGATRPGSSVAASMRDPSIRQQVGEIWSGVQSGQIPNPYPGATHFHTPQVNPSWSQQFNNLGQLGNHIFYSDGSAPASAPQRVPVSMPTSADQRPAPLNPIMALAANAGNSALQAIQGAAGGPEPFDWSTYATGGAAARSDSFTGLNSDFSSALEQMFRDAPGGLAVQSAYRSPETQQQLWNDALRKYGSEAEARKWVAPPGNSQHNHGNAADLKYLSPEAKAWVHANASKYGLAFPLGHEPWHIELASARSGRPGQMLALADSGGRGVPTQQRPGFWSVLTGPLKSLLPQGMNVPIAARQLAANPQVQQAAIGPLMGSLAGRNVLMRGLMNMNIGASPTITPGAAGPGTRAVAVSNQGASPVMMTSNGGSGAASSGAHGNWNPDVYRANTAVLGSGGHNQASINNALSQGKTLYKLA